MDTKKYTLVQHTGYSVGRKPEFKDAVELRSITDNRTLSAVVTAGGLIYNSYREASNAEEKTNFPDGYGGMIPIAMGKFKHVKSLGEDVFIPEKR